MKLHALALGLTLGILWGGAILLTGLVNLIWPGYGVAFLEVIGSIYPGFYPGGGVGTVLLGTVYALADGVIGGVIVAWLYNVLARKFSA
ncbi:MAG: hypothetical protein RI563_10895 [Thiohalophilus sp.]|uniref:hypothetical protein n=1 Tax=Thiohalophilus sp. TaxID=3028392 RepID=UPI002870811F|nr:hypothetical protein [Thiohalophilus sp.]MDR9437384.1 hypothetical protein [Thiohalophilus sp.]